MDWINDDILNLKFELTFIFIVLAAGYINIGLLLYNNLQPN